MTTRADLDRFLRECTAEDDPVREVRLVACACRGDTFTVAFAGEDAVRRTCTACGTQRFVCDSEEYWQDNLDDGDGVPEDAQCPCGNETFQMAVGFALRPAGDDVKWIYVALRCTKCGELGLYADWKIDYSPSLQLLDQA